MSKPHETFSAVEFRETANGGRAFCGWGVWFNDGPTLSGWVFKSDDLTQKQAQGAAIICNYEWATEGLLMLAYCEGDGFNAHIERIVAHVKSCRERPEAIARANKRAQDSVTIHRLSATCESLRKQLENERREREAAQRTIARLGGEQ